MLGIIGGGNMGEALIKGIISSNLYKKNEIIVCEIAPERCEYLTNNYEIITTQDLQILVEKSDIIIFAVKPQIIDNVLNELKDFDLQNKLLISIAAGVKIEKFEKYLGKDKKIIRVMPNACAFVLESMSALSRNRNINNEDMKIAANIFNAIGETVEVPEYQLDAITGLSGSGPGYVAVIMEAFVDAAVLVGLSRDIAEKLVMQTFKGTIKLKQQSNKTFYEIKSMVTSPGGTTISGIHELEKGNLRATIMNCIERATQRSKELS